MLLLVTAVWGVMAPLLIPLPHAGRAEPLRVRAVWGVLAPLLLPLPLAGRAEPLRVNAGTTRPYVVFNNAFGGNGFEVRPPPGHPNSSVL